MAHPDDLEHGAASAIAKWTAQGKQVTYLLVPKGEAGIDSMELEETARVRVQEEIESATIVGVSDVNFFDYADGVVEYGLPLRRDITRVICQHRPDVLITLNHNLTFGGGMFNIADHWNVGLAVLDASRDAGNRWIFPELLKEGLEPWNNVRMVCVAGSPNPTHAVDVTGSLDKGIESLQKHRVYIQNLSNQFDPVEFLQSKASNVGGSIGCKYAVSFEVFGG